MGDLNGDGSINVNDIIVEINIITTLIEPTDYHWIVGDLNIDGSINVLDIVSIVNLILGISLSQSNYDEAELEITSSSFSLINSNGLAGFQFKYDGELENDIILKDWNITINNGFIVVFI